MKNTIEPPFWDHLSRDNTKYGWDHKGDPGSEHFVPDALFVFVHGILSGPEVWNDLAPRIMHEAKIDADAFALKYCVFPFFEGSNARAADDLSRALESRCKITTGDENRNETIINRYRHLVFITHSNGGLVVKRWFTHQAEAALKQHREIEPDVSGIQAPLALTVRLILNVATPNAGGTHFWSFVAGGVLFLNFLVWPILWLLNQVTHWYSINLGLNTIAWSLVRWNPDLKQQEMAFQEVLNSLKTHGWTRPPQLDFRAQSDVYAKDWAKENIFRLSESERPTYSFKGGHILSSIIGKEMIAYISKIIPTKDHFERLTIADHYCAINRSRESQLRIETLVGTPEPAQKGQQLNVMRWLNSWVERPDKGLQKTYVCGAAGTGKSRVLARLARELLTNYLSELRGTGNPVIYVNLRDVILPITGLTNPITETLLNRILAGWNVACQKAPNIPSYFLRCVSDAILHPYAIIVFDGLDDFLGRNPSLHWQDLPNLWETLQNHNPNCAKRLIVGVRNGHPVIDYLRGCGNWDQATIELMTDDEIDKHCPEVRGVVNRARNENAYDAEEVLHSPLVAFALRRDLVELGELLNASVAAPFNVARVLTYSLRAIVRETLPTTQDGSIIDRAIDALMLLGRISYFRPQRKQNNQSTLARKITLEDIKEGVGEITHEWDERFTTNDLASQRIAAASNQLLDKDWTNNILRSVFQSLSDGQWDFTHPRWRDILVARYYAFCAEQNHLEAFGGIAYLPNITGLAGQLLGTWQLEADTIRRAAFRSLADHDGMQPDCLYVSNLMALAAWNPNTILEGEAWSASLDVFTDKRHAGFSRCLIMNVTMIRWLRLSEHDRDPLRKRIRMALRKCITAESPRASFVAHQALCYLNLIDNNLSRPPTLTQTSPIKLQARQIAWDRYKQELPKFLVQGLMFADPEAYYHRFFVIPDSVAPEQSLQMSLIQLVQLLKDKTQQPVRGVATVHYLVMLLLFWKSDRWSNEARVALKDTFEKDSLHSQFYNGTMKNHGLPDYAKQLYVSAQETWRKL